MHKCIRQFEAGERIDGFYLISQYSLRTSSNHKKYLDLTLSDKSGEINAKVWDIDEDTEKNFKAGDIVKVRGDVTLWQEQMQFKIIKLRHPESADEYNISDVIASAPYPAEEMYDFILQEISLMEDEELRLLCESIWTDRREKILYYPAAMRNHHAIHAGLLYHLYRMLKSGKFLSELYELNWDLLLTGILLHDIDKLTEMVSNEMGIVSHYSNEGILLGHIVTGIKLAEQYGEKLGISDHTRMLIQHMILSHHYEPEYGSPKKPMFPEAELLHHLDMIDARMYDMKKALDDTKEGFSDPIFSLEKRRIFKTGK